MPQSTKQKYPVGKQLSLRGDTSDPDVGELRSRSAKKRPRAADATSISSDTTISESSSDDSAGTFSPSLGKVEAIKEHLNTTLEMVAELERDLSPQEEQ